MTLSVWTRIVVGGATVATLAVAPTAQTGPSITFTETKLANGLRVILSEDRAAPVYSIAVHYNVGSRDEPQGRTGFAHLFEHMMFKGSENIGPGEHFMLVFNNGGSMNGTTNKDRTLYFETMPANQLDLGIFLEADRMRSLVITKANLDNQRHAVQEERRLGRDNQPYGRSRESLEELAYDNPAYKHSVIGSMADLDAASVDDVAAFFKTYYAPNNAVLAIVGDIDVKVALGKVRKAFEPIPAQPAPPAVDMTEPKQSAERRLTLDDALARLTRVDMAFKVPPRTSDDDDAVGVLATILSTGRSSRLYQKVVREQQLAANVNAFRDGAVGPGLFSMTATVAPGKTAAAVEAALLAEIEGVKAGPIAEWEMDKARNNAKRAVVSGLTSSLTRAIQLAEFASVYGNAGRINQRIDRIARVTASDVQRVATAYLTVENRTVVVTQPKPVPSKGDRQ